MKKILTVIKSFCTFLGSIFLIGGMCSLVVLFFQSKNHEIQNNTALVIDLDNDFTENQQESILQELSMKPHMNFLKLLQSIEFAATDKNITSLVAKIDTTNMDLAQIQELANTILYFRQQGKKTYVYSRGFGSFGGGNKEYYLATFFDEIYMQPHTYIGLTGLSFEIPFVKEFLDKIGVYPEFFTRYEYKTSMMSFTDTTISKPYSENLNNLGNSILSVLKTSITENRKLNKDVHDIINNAPIKASDGVNYNMIDGIMYLSEFEKKLKDEGNKHFVYIEDYALGLYPNNEKSYPTIAFLSINGLISNGNSFSDFNGEYTTGSKTIIADIEKIKNINNLKAVIVRINSPGGDYNASDEIYQSLTQLKKDKNIPIIVSQSGYAASGGYFISLAGDKIVAEPSTITGSIGVLGGKFVLEDLWKKIGINWTDIKFGNNSDMLSLNKKFTKSEQKIFEESLDDVYKDFTSKVIENRPLKENIENIAKGRIWTGIQAKEIGLVDEIGGYGVAISLAKQKANIPNDAYFNIVIYPQEKTFSEKIRELILNPAINVNEFISKSGVDIRYLKLFKRLQYDTVLPMFEINM